MHSHSSENDRLESIQYDIINMAVQSIIGGGVVAIPSPKLMDPGALALPTSFDR
jgi:hypothetical protein